MIVFDTNFLIYLLDSKNAAEVVDYYTNPRTTTITLFELYYGVNCSVKKEENILNLNSLLRSIQETKTL